MLSRLSNHRVIYFSKVSIFVLIFHQQSSEASVERPLSINILIYEHSIVFLLAQNKGSFHEQNPSTGVEESVVISYKVDFAYRCGKRNDSAGTS